MNTIVNLSRRQFLGATAAGLVLGLSRPRSARAGSGEPAEVAFNAYLRISPDGVVTLVTPDAEMGQGVHNSLPLLIAEELEVDWALVRIELSGANDAYANPSKRYQSSGQSAAIRGFYLPLRKVGAAAREMLIAAAAAQWGVPAAACRAAGGRVLHDSSRRSAGYGELAAAAAALEPPAEPRLKDPREFRLIGRSQPRKDTPAKIDGSAVFGSDVVLPGMLHASIRACPVHGGRLLGVEEGPIAGMARVHGVVRLDDAVAVLAEDWWSADEALRRLDIRFDTQAGRDRDTDSERAALLAALDRDGVVGIDRGGALGRLAGAALIEATYEVPYLAHATMEPMTCAAQVEGDRCTIWAPSQTPGMAREAAARVLGIPAANVTLHRSFLGGGFGRRFQNDFVRQCVLIARAAGRPVRLMWSREEDMRHDFYRPMYFARYRATLAEGAPVAVHVRVAGPSIFAWMRPGTPTDKPDPSVAFTLLDEELKLPALRVEHVVTGTPLPIGLWRAVSHSQNTFFKESFMDELAHAAGRDPLEFRLALLGDERLKAVLRLAAEKAGWGRPLPKGRALGIAALEGYGSYCAQVAEVSVEGDHFRVERVVCAIDCGVAVEPRNVAAQAHGGIVYGLSAAASGEITFRDGAVEQGNFDDYPVLRLKQMPTIEVHLVPSAEAPGGMGELATPPIAPAVCNAIFAATGRRIRRLPVARAGLTLA